MLGGRSASMIQFLSRDVAALFGLDDRTVDGPPLWCGQSAGVLKKSSREVVSLAWAERLDCGRSGQGERMVCWSLNNLTRDDFASGGLHDVKGGRSAPQTLSLFRDAVSLSVRSV